MDILGFLCTSNTQKDDNTDLADGDGCQWAWSNWWRAWQSQPFSWLEAARDSIVHEVSLDVSARLLRVPPPEVFAPTLHASWSLQN